MLSSSLATLLPAHQRFERELRPAIKIQRAAFETRDGRLMEAKQIGQLSLIEGQCFSNCSDIEHAGHYMHASIINQEEYACKN